MALAYTSEELEELEESFLRMFNCVESDDFYNIKFSSSGGDTFTTNPRREEISNIHSNLVAGRKNPMYGKEKSELTISRIKEANSRRVQIDGVVYTSAREAARVLMIPDGTVQSRLRSKNYTNWIKLEPKSLTTIETRN